MKEKTFKNFNNSNFPNSNSIKGLLNTDFIGSSIYTYDILDSTNLEAKKIANKNFKDGSIIISRTQSSGVGRFNREWHSPEGGIWTSLILKPNFSPKDASKITLIAACSLYKTLKYFKVDSKIKWPNDIYINGKKCAGILTTMNSHMNKINYLIVGIGLNVNIDSSHFRKNLKNATSLSIELSESLNLYEVFNKLIENFEYLYKQFILHNDLSETITIFKEHSYGLNKIANLITPSGSEKVIPIKIDDFGELIVKDSNGKLKKIISGEITFHK